MQNKPIRFGPVALTTTSTTNILNPPTLTGGVNVPGSNTYILLRHIRIVNKTASAVTVALWLGSTGANAAGTEVIFGGAASAGTLTQGTQVPANGYLDWYGNLRMEPADFLVGGAGTATALAFEAEGEIGIV